SFAMFRTHLGGRGMPVANVLQNAVSGLRAYGVRQAATADAIANVATEGYTSAQVDTVDAVPGGVNTAVRPSARGAGVDGLALANDVSLSGALTDLIINRQSFSANVATARAAADLGRVLNETARD
ncbi:MAG: hypothetical protein AAF684_06175, partial [Pseudomonadota bacterium]